MDKLDEIASPKLATAIRQEVRQACEQQLNDLWIAVSAARESNNSSGSVSSSEIADIVESLTQTQQALTNLKEAHLAAQSENDKKIRGVRKKLGQQLSEERPALPTELLGKLDALDPLRNRLEKAERDVAQTLTAASMLENRLYDLENRISRRLENVENRPAIQAAAPVGQVGESLSTESLLSIPTNFSFQVEDLLKVVIKYEGSDLYLKSNALPYTSLQGDLVPIGKIVMSASDCRRVVLLALSPQKRKELEDRRSVHQLACWHNTVFRIHAYYERDRLSATVHRVSSDIPTLERYQFGSSLEDLLQVGPGILISAIPSDSLRQEFMAGVAAHLTSRHRVRLFTLEQNIEYEIADGEGLVTQQEIGTDVPEAFAALQSIKMLAPEIVLVNCPLDAKNWQQILEISGRSFVVVGSDAHRVVDALEGIQQLYNGERKNIVAEQLSKQLRGAIAVHSLPGRDTRDGQQGASVTATELLGITEETMEFLKEGHYRLLEPVMERGMKGMHTFRISYAKLADLGLIHSPRHFVTQEMPAVSERRPNLSASTRLPEIDFAELPPLPDLETPPAAAPTLPKETAVPKPPAAAPPTKEVKPSSEGDDLMGWL